jgi:hypothetical protein
MKDISFRFTHVQSPLVVLLLVLGALLVTCWMYRRSPGGRRPPIFILLSGLRLAALLLALVFLLRPVVSFDRILRQDRRVAVLLDRSRSMETRDSVLGESRLESAARVATSEAVDRLGDSFDLQRYAFSGPGTLGPWDPPKRPGGPGGAPRQEIAAEGSSTDLESAWSSVPVGPAPVEAAVLVSDGRDHGKARALKEEASFEGLPPFPVHCVAVGSGGGMAGNGGAREPQAPDAGWVNVRSEGKALRGSKILVRGTVATRGLPAGPAWVSARLDAKEIARSEVRLEPGTREVTFSLVPDRSGVLFYHLVLQTGGKDAHPENDGMYLPVEVTDKPLQVLIYEGRPRWQYKFASRALEREPSVNFTGLVRLGGTRSLEQGLAPASLSKGLPETRDAWRAFDVLVLGNVASEDFAPGDLERIQSWIGEDGGGLILACGREGWQAFAGTPLAEALPAAAALGEKVVSELRVFPGGLALDHPMTRGLEEYFVPGRPGGPFFLAEGFSLRPLRPGSEPLLWMECEGPEKAPAKEARERLPLLVVRPYGKGRTVALFTESEWRWATERAQEGGADLLALLWGRMARWAAKRDDAARGGLGIRLSRRAVRTGEEVGMEVHGAADPSTVKVTVVRPDGRSVSVPGTIDSRVWTGKWAPDAAGVHSVQASSGPSLQAGAAFAADPDCREVEDTSPDWDLLRRLAEQTGGKFFTLTDFGSIADLVLRDTKGAVAHVEMGVDRSWPLYLALVALLGLEWLLRRRVQVI